MKFSVVTLFPEMFSGVFDYSIVNRALKDKKIEVEFINLRDFGLGRHKTVDDKPYGGGAGMVLRADVLKKAIDHAKIRKGNGKVILFDAVGERYSQEKTEEFSKLDHIILVCGRYEGFDARIREFVDYAISVGDYILTGGEIPAMIIIDSVTRLIPGVLSKETATKLESFSRVNPAPTTLRSGHFDFSLREQGVDPCSPASLREAGRADEQGIGCGVNKKRILEYPQYTRPEEFEGLKVPEVLLSGNEAKINEFREKEAIKLTKKHRPDLL